jgi:adenine-specific DNA-methyltransferase
MNTLPQHTPNITAQHIEKIAELFPHVVTERENEQGEVVRAIDFDALRQVLSGDIVEGIEERYRLDWPGKKRALLKANTPIAKTLRPVREESVDFETTQNLFIEGDNFEALKILQESYLGKVKMIYIDPPYNTGKDFVYSDNFTQNKAEYEEEIEAVDEEGNKMFRENTRTNPRFHSDWLSMMYERLTIARDLLRDDGVIFISIDDNEVHNLRKICDEVFGEENLVGTIIHQRAKGGGMAKNFVNSHDYIHVYARNIETIDIKQQKIVQQNIVEIDGEKYVVNDDLYRRKFGGKIDKSAPHRCFFYEEIESVKGIEEKDRIDKLIEEGSYFLKPHKTGNHLIARYEKISESYSKVYPIIKILSEIGKQEMDALMGEDIFSYPKPVDLVKFLVEISTIESKNTDKDLILDFFSGSATTAHAVMQQNAEDGGNRKFIMVQLPEATPEGSEARKAGYENIAQLGRERIRRAGEKIKKDYAEKLKERKEKGLPPLDTGFRTYRVDTTNMLDTTMHPSEVTQKNLLAVVENIKRDRTPEDLLAEVMLKLGLMLDLPIETLSLAGNTVYAVGGNSLFACFDTTLHEGVVDEIAKRAPLRLVLRDATFGAGNDRDQQRTNLEIRLKHLSPETSVVVL